MEINADTKMRQVIYTDFFDELLCLKLLDSIAIICDHLDRLKYTEEELLPHQREDWDQLLEDLYCVESAYVYYSGNYAYTPRLEEYEND